MADVSDPQLKEAYDEVRSDKVSTQWTVFGYEGNAKIVLQGKGDGGLNELGQLFEDDQAQYAFIRVTSGDQESKRAKFVFISWCGEKVGALKRAKMSVHKASVKQIIKEFALEVHYTDKSEVSEEDLLSRVKKAGGADYSGTLSN
eukprot:TRINITY_DN22488_c0_g1_i1.p1 TRINITY_DN22488_c0_g1~~TRINITY_DN22488_c0_g1_i1.p1  ORF type:complete len:145 (+),score=30.27 TRINITY_DN22488_c0_g1_i1:122-556(+)